MTTKIFSIALLLLCSTSFRCTATEIIEQNDAALHPWHSEYNQSIDAAVIRAETHAHAALEARKEHPTFEGRAEVSRAFSQLCGQHNTISVFVYGQMLNSDFALEVVSPKTWNAATRSVAFGAQGLFNVANDYSEPSGLPNILTSDDPQNVAPGVVLDLTLNEFQKLASQYDGYDFVPLAHVGWEDLLAAKENAPSFHIVYTFSAPYASREGRYPARDDLCPDTNSYALSKMGAASLGNDFLYLWLRRNFLADGKIVVDSWDRFHLTPLSTLEGQHMLRSSGVNRDFWSLIQHFQTQRTNALCAVASSVMIMNALPHKPAPRVSYYAWYRYYTQEEFFTDEVLEVVDPVDVAVRGMKLVELARVLEHAYKLKVHTYLGSITSLEEMRNTMIRVLEEPNQYIIANYFRPALGQIRAGHFSPVAAYNEEMDAFLILDVSRYKYPPIWVPAERLWEATSSCDGDGSWGRGFLTVGY